MKQVTIKVEILPSGRERYAVPCSNCGDTQRVERVLVGREVLLPVAAPPRAALAEDEDTSWGRWEASDPPEASEPPKARQRKAAPSKPRRPPTPRPRARAGAKGGR